MLVKSVVALDGGGASKSAEFRVEFIDCERTSPLRVELVGEPGNGGDSEGEVFLGDLRPVREKTLVRRCGVGRRKLV